jgi:hypothetical protein
MRWIGHRFSAERKPGAGRHAGANARADGHPHSHPHTHAYTPAAPARGCTAASAGSSAAQGCSASTPARLQRWGRGQQGRPQRR